MTRTLVFAALLIGLVGYLMYPNQGNKGVLSLPDEGVASMSRTSENDTNASNFAPSHVSIDIDQRELDSEVGDVDEPRHIGEFIDPDDLSVLQGGEPLHIGTFLDPDTPIYEVDDVEIHIGEDLSAYDPMEYTNEENVEPLRIGEDLSAYDPSEISVLRDDDLERHEGEIVYDP